MDRACLTARSAAASNHRRGLLVGRGARRHGGATSRSSIHMLLTTRTARTSRPLAALAAAALASVLLAGCGAALADAPPDVDATPTADDAADLGTDPVDDQPDDRPASAAGRLDVELDGSELRVLDATGARLLGWELPTDQGEVFHALLSRPDVPEGEVDATVVTIRGEVPRLWHLRVREGQDGALLPFPDHLQPQSELEAVISVSWTPDAGSLLWTEPRADGVTLRTVGWADGPGTGRTADDHASFPLDLPADATIDGSVVEADGTWTVSLLDGIGTWHELTLVRQADGALALIG